MVLLSKSKKYFAQMLNIWRTWIRFLLLKLYPFDIFFYLKNNAKIAFIKYLFSSKINETKIAHEPHHSRLQDYLIR
jgi:hypothetical protein